MNPDPFTLRELTDMAEGRERENWNHTADQMAHAANMQRTSDRDRVFSRRDFHPYLQSSIKVISDPKELA
jgi:hypothetical protein